MDLLLIDDDEIDRTAIQRALADSSLRVKISEATTAEQGLALVAEQTFDGILLDYRLPDADGIEVLARLSHAVGDDTAVVIISRYEDETLAERCIELGAQDFLLKDEVNSRRLTRAIRQAHQRAAIMQELRRSHQQLKSLAEHDSLTQLANRYGFETFLYRELAKARCQHGKLALILLDLDDFKLVNDALGHQAGDRLLELVAERLLRLVPSKGMIARIGGDEFVAVLCGDEAVAEAEQWVTRCLEVLQPSYEVQGKMLSISASAGIAYYGALAKSGSELLRCADIAMYKAKHDGRNRYQVYSETLNIAVNQRIKIAQGLNQAIEKQQLRLFYQGKFSATTGELVGTEALLRWQHPDMGMLAPDAFLPVAEERGMMDELAAWVLTEACIQNQRWLNMLPDTQEPISVAVNLSPSQNLKQLLLPQVTAALARSAMPAQYLELELTENALIEDSLALAETLEAVRKLGVTLALDDFGTGFSSLEHIKDFPIQVLKMDKSFVLPLEQCERSRRLLSALLNFAKGLNVIAVAEGVETAQHAEFCRAHGCDILQGYYFCKPLPAAEFERQFILPKA
ncbi:EAL domain-containing protein [Shewanella avicenniae]|uniref:EAL domain-containing protein n=1 Tax=Shewanella avicenniae TaxID=2814294 RepID=A0ABX7QR02_9GAMM|nr:EAL domain-containing response regulator [Shewanella avicenniae]QSX33330.1 EAL domain-containing protein [Shewanella avicenniae]